MKRSASALLKYQLQVLLFLQLCYAFNKLVPRKLPLKQYAKDIASKNNSNVYFTSKGFSRSVNIDVNALEICS